MHINSLINIKDSSSSFQKSKDLYEDQKFNYKSFYDLFYAKDFFYFDSNKNANLKFIYSPNDNQKLSTCLNISFMPFVEI